MCLQICSTSPPGGNHVDGLPPAASMAGQCDACIFYIEYLKGRNFSNSKFRYKCEDDAVIFSPLFVTILSPDTDQQGQNLWLKNHFLNFRKFNILSKYNH